jgi:hypothetical protein
MHPRPRAPVSRTAPLTARVLPPGSNVSAAVVAVDMSVTRAEA